MFRENVLVKNDVIKRISTTMVPVALNYQRVQDTKSPESRFLRPLIGSKGDRQGVYIFSPSGKKLGQGISFGNMKVKTLKMIAQALKTFGPVSPRKVKKASLNLFRGKGVRPDGSVRLASCGQLLSILGFGGVIPSWK